MGVRNFGFKKIRICSTIITARYAWKCALSKVKTEFRLNFSDGYYAWVRVILTIIWQL